MQDFSSKLVWQVVKILIRLRFPQVRPLTVAQLADWLQHERPLLLDARKPAEYQVSHLPGADLAPANLSELPQSQHQPIVVYCSVGYRSAKLANRLQQMGFEAVYNLEGSIFEWANMGYPVYRGNEAVQQVHPYNPNWGKLLRSDWHCYAIDSPACSER